MQIERFKFFVFHKRQWIESAVFVTNTARVVISHLAIVREFIIVPSKDDPWFPLPIAKHFVLLSKKLISRCGTGIYCMYSIFKPWLFFVYMRQHPRCAGRI